VPLYEYRCEAGHSQDRFFHPEDPKPRVVRCKTCRRRARRVFSLSVQPLIYEYYDRGMGRVIKGRTHLREVQRELGCADADIGGMKPRPPEEFSLSHEEKCELARAVKYVPGPKPRR
jgi:hypothetical protein